LAPEFAAAGAAITAMSQAWEAVAAQLRAEMAQRDVADPAERDAVLLAELGALSEDHRALGAFGASLDLGRCAGPGEPLWPHGQRIAEGFAAIRAVADSADRLAEELSGAVCD
jgi:hypothetical protein